MREIKFRAWDLELNEMCYDFLKNNWLKVCINSPYVKIMQYTGLKDSEGVEIYEGDVIRFFPYHSEYQVVFDDCSFCLADLKGRIIESLFDGIGEIKVIGNIYENPELLRGDIK